VREKGIKPDIILASASPRRKEILEQMGFNVCVHPSDFNENTLQITDPEEFAVQAAREKASVVSIHYPELITVAADTVVTLDGILLGKPDDYNDAFTMLNRLSGRTHDVITGISIHYPVKNCSYSGFEKTEVTFRLLADEEIKCYLSEHKPFDKAGAYGIQDLTVPLVSNIRGCYFNVVGFPVSHFYIHWRNIVNIV